MSEQPGQFPYTRGIHEKMYRERLWTMRQFAGFASAEETNKRFRYLLEEGQTGLSVAFDLPTLMGCDADDAASLGEVGKCGVAISSVEDMETLFAGIPLDQVSVSMTINSPAPVLFAMYLVVAERQGVSWELLSGTLQNDILKELARRKNSFIPPALPCASRWMPWNTACATRRSSTLFLLAATTFARLVPRRLKSLGSRCVMVLSMWSG